MLEILQFVLADGYNFAGSLILLIVLYAMFGASTQSIITSYFDKKIAFIKEESGEQSKLLSRQEALADRLQK